MKIQVQKTLDAAGGKMLLDVNMRLEEGSFIAISGPSGSGKTTLLRIIAGLTEVENGQIIIKGVPWFDLSKSINLKAQKRRVGYVFQNYALFPNMNVRQNLTYALEKNQPKKIVDELIEVMELQALTNKFPKTLSGGQQQRVALARALVRKPHILLLDEPLSALDIEMRAHLQNYILKLHKSYGLTTILVSHDLSEIFKMADRVFVLQNGKIAKTGSPEAVFLNQPISGKFKLAGEVLHIVPSDLVYIVSIKIGNNIVRIIASPEEVETLHSGDKVILISKAFKPFIFRGEV